MSKKTLVWFRNDLRLHDNEMLVEAISKSDEVLPVYIFDPRHFEKSIHDTYKTGKTRALFLLESVQALRNSFQALGGNLLVLVGAPEELLPTLVTQYELSEVYHHREVASEETEISVAVEDALWKLKVNLKHFIGHTLYNKEDLPFPVKDIPDVFTQFKKKAERDAFVKPCFLTPTEMSFVEVEDWANLPSVEQLLPLVDGVAANELINFKGGEQHALAHLHDYLHVGEGIVMSKTVLKKHEIVSKLSAWLSIGCLSPREVYWKMREAEESYGVRPYYNQIVLGLLWRDYFRFMFKKHGNTFFYPNGFKANNGVSTSVDYAALQQWKTGTTSHPVVNFYMQELNNTGYISTIARQLVALYLVQELRLSWVLGAAYFEEVLIDYCPASNWGNWATIAGVGNDQKLSNSFSFEKISKTLTPKTATIQGVHA